MGRLNYRLIASVLAGAILLTLFALPSTSELTQRKVRTVFGEYRVPVFDRLSQFSADPDDDQIVELLSASELTPEVRAFGLAKAASKTNSPPLWAHVIRNATRLSAKGDGHTKLTETEQMRRNTVARLALLAARSGAKSDPANAFFPLSVATSLAATGGPWDEVLKALLRAASLDKFDDYAGDEVDRRVASIRRKQSTVLASDVGREAASVVMPHFSTYLVLAEATKDIEDPRTRLKTGLAIARIGSVLQRNGAMRITRMVGSAMIQRTINATALRPKRLTDTENELGPVVESLAAQAETMGMPEIAEGWNGFTHWKREADFGIPSDLDLSNDESIPTLRSIYQMIFVASLGGMLWFLAKVEPGLASIGVLATMLVAIGIAWGASVDRQLPATAVMGGSGCLFAAFLAFRLPGKAWATLAYAVTGVALIVASAALSWQYSALNMIAAAWAIPFVLSAWTKFAVPKWAIIVLLFIGEAVIWQFVGTDVSSHEDVSKHSWYRLIASAAMASFWTPLAIAYVMAWGKVRYEEAVKLALAPIPILVLGSAVLLAWNVREEVRLERAWGVWVKEELPKEFPGYRG